MQTVKQRPSDMPFVSGSIDSVIECLTGLQRSDGGWPYEPGQTTGFVEPTCWALLALRGLGLLTDTIASSGSSFLKKLQLPDGGFCSGTINREANWSTALAVWCLAVLDREEAAAGAGERWLLGFNGYHWQKPKNSPLGHDTAIQGWPWLLGCHSWIEPTSYAVYALNARGNLNHPRLVEARRMIADRCLPNGGWNYGNTIILGSELRPFPSTTAAALIALRGGGDEFDQFIDRSLDYLNKALPLLRTPWALGWAQLALRCLASDLPRFPEPEAMNKQLGACLARQTKPGARLRVHELAIALLASCPLNRMPFSTAVEDPSAEVTEIR